MKHGISGEGWGWKETGRGQVAMDVKGVGTVGDRTEVPSLCRPLPYR